MKRKNNIFAVLCPGFTGILIFAVSLTGFTARYGFSTWDELDIDEIILHLRAPLTGAGTGMVQKYLVTALLPAFLLTFLYIFVMSRVKEAQKRNHICAGCVLLCVIAAILVKDYLWKGLNVEKWIEDQKNDSHFIEENYVDPSAIKIKFPEKKKNLVFIYLESMETTYADEASGGGFKKNVIPGLTEIAVSNEDFSGANPGLNGGIVYQGSHNTMAAIFTHFAGLPLKVDIGLNNMDTQKSFFPGITTLGDVLRKEGYRQVFLLGSDATFGGRSLFFKDHGNFEIRDLEYAKEKGWIPQDYYVWWGYEDEKLFQFAKETLLELAKDSQPFHLSMLTVDTHFEDGYICRLCRNEFGTNQYANVMACSSRQISDFIRWVRKQDFYEDTVVVLVGDHRTMDNDFCVDVDSDYLRRTYTAYLNTDAEPEEKNHSRVYSTLDTFPTTLAALGASIEGNRLGLGTNLFSEVPTLTEEYGMEYLKQEIPRRSSFLRRLEHTQGHSKAMVERIRANMRNAIKVVSYNPSKGKIDLEVNVAPDLYLDLKTVEAVYQEKGIKSAASVRLEKKQGAGKIYVGTLDISGWKETNGEIRISIMLKDGTAYRDVVCKNLQELLPK
ncbi:MAG: LTA synthase family protein [Eubacteriales bacterium]|nr:LTA synthase family protein [Eubacteriales bacterium]